jgi:seryl-tRNA synthetase
MQKTYTTVLLLSLLLLQCRPIDNTVPPDSDDVYEVRDSIREVMLLRLGEAMQEINRRTEKMRRKAYSVPKQEANRLRAQAKALEKQYQQISERTQHLKQDSVLGQWYHELDELEVQLLDISQTLGISL